MLELEPQEAEEKEEIVEMKILKEGCDVFFCRKSSGLAKAGRRTVAQFVQSRGAGAGTPQLRDLDAGWRGADAPEKV